MDQNRLFKAATALVDLVAKLRGPGGCPWDAAQTDSTIKSYLLEEAYEVLDAIEKASPSDVCLELGDLLFHILFLAQLAEERKEFDFVEVIEKIAEKMIRRHPHVFGESHLETPEEVVDNWAKIKQKEHRVENEESPCLVSYLNSVPRTLPALMRAHRLSERVSKISEDPSISLHAWDKALHRFETLKKAVDEKDEGRFAREMGEYLFCLANLTRLWGFNSEHLLMAANEEFINRVEKT